MALPKRFFIDDVINVLVGVYAGYTGVNAADMPYLWAIVGATALHKSEYYRESALLRNEELKRVRESERAFTPGAASLNTFLNMPKNPTLEQVTGGMKWGLAHSFEVLVGYVIGRTVEAIVNYA